MVSLISNQLTGIVPPKRSSYPIKIIKMQTIALADNYPQIRGFISSLITNLPGYAVSIEVGNGYQLVKQISCVKKLPAIAILDIQMPVMDGVYATHFLTGHYPAIKVLAISYHTDPAMVMDMLYAGASGYLVKENLSGHLLLKAFASILSGNTFIDETINNQEFLLPPTTRTTLPNTWHPGITEKEKNFLQLSVTSISYDQIAGLMNVAEESVYNYQKSLKEKLGFGSRHEFMAYAIQHGIAKIASYTKCTHYRINQ